MLSGVEIVPLFLCGALWLLSFRGCCICCMLIVVWLCCVVLFSDVFVLFLFCLFVPLCCCLSTFCSLAVPFAVFLCVRGVALCFCLCLFMCNVMCVYVCFVLYVV